MKYLKVFTDFAEDIAPLTDAEKGRLFTAMLDYAASGKAPDLRGNERYLWAQAKKSVDRERDFCELQKMKSALGGRPKGKPEETRGNPNEPEETRENPKKANKDKDKDNVFLPNGKNTVMRLPSVEEVAEYCRERGNGIDAQTFVDFYAAKGWMVGKTRMKDWRAAVRTWEQRRKKESRPDRMSNLQRMYDEEVHREPSGND